jgi:membrane protease YdiL (CAAX protease family)
MLSLREWIARHPLAAFIVLSLAVSWGISLPFVALAWSQTGRRGVELPALTQMAIASGPALAACLCTFAISGAAGLRDFCKRWFSGGFNRSAWWLAVIIPLGIFVIALLLGRLRYGSWPSWQPAIAAAPAEFIGALLLAVWNGPGEEPGWRGYALPRLLTRHSPLSATALITAAWVPWHLPMFFYRGELSLLQFSAFAVALFFGAIWLTGIYRLSGGSILACVVWHALWNIVASSGRARNSNNLELLLTVSGAQAGSRVHNARWNSRMDLPICPAH